MPKSLNEDEQRTHQTQLIMKLFELWNLTDKEKAIALGLSPDTQTSVHKYKTGKQNLPLARDTQDRIGHLLAIHKFLRRAYPYNKELAYQWIKSSNTDFNNHAPFDLISIKGYLGLLQVRYYLEINEHQHSDTGGMATLSLPLFYTFDTPQCSTSHLRSRPFSSASHKQTPVKKTNRR